MFVYALNLFDQFVQINTFTLLIKHQMNVQNKFFVCAPFYIFIFSKEPYRVEFL